jgi:hypothetical protein
MSKYIRKFGLLNRKTDEFLVMPHYNDALVAIEIRDALVIGADYDVVLVLLDLDGSVKQFYRSDTLATKERYLASEKVKVVMLCLKGNPLPEGAVEKAVMVGLLPKKDLVDGRYYYGHCRNARVARWDANGKPGLGVEEGSAGRFVHIRHKFGESFPESINHPEDDNGFDFFIPVAEIEPFEGERVDDESLRSTR